MANYAALLDRLRRGERILIDGGTGSEAKSAGFPRLRTPGPGQGC